VLELFEAFLITKARVAFEGRHHKHAHRKCPERLMARIRLLRNAAERPERRCKAARIAYQRNTEHITTPLQKQYSPKREIF